MKPQKITASDLLDPEFNKRIMEEAEKKCHFNNFGRSFDLRKRKKTHDTEDADGPFLSKAE